MWKKYVKVGHGTLFKARSGIWNLVYSIKGREKCRSLGTKDFDDAERKRDEIVEAARLGIIDEMSRIPLLDSWSLYASSHDARWISDEGMRRRFAVWRGFAAWMRDRHPEVADAAAIQRKMANEYIDFHSAGHAAATTNKTVFLLRGMLDAICGTWSTAGNPFAGAMILPWDSHSRRSLEREEMARLLDAAKKTGAEYYRLFLVATYTGLRLGECCSIKWENIDVRRGILQFVPGKTRRYLNGRPVTVPLHWKLLKALLATHEDCRTGAVLPELARAYAANRWCAKRTIARIFKSAGIETSIRVAGRVRRVPEASFHSLRHSFVSFAANAGVPLESLRAIVGHASTAMTRHYYHAAEEDLRRAVASVPVFDARGNVVSLSAKAAGESALSQRLLHIEALFRDGLVSESECNEVCMRIAAEA